MIKFNETTISADASIIFLCGTKYNRKNIRDKRIILKEYLEKNFPSLNVLILEEHFVFGKKAGYLSYDDIFMNNLSDIEEISAAFASGIIIIHESISTGAELAAFASNEFLVNKICVLEPDSTGIEERKISSFLELAYFGDGSTIERITYYPQVYPYRISKDHIEKHTNFVNNKITPILGGKVNRFIEKCNAELDIRFEKMLYKKINYDKGVVSYALENNRGLVYVPGRVVLYQVMGLLNCDEIRASIRKFDKLHSHISFLDKQYRNVMMTTIQGKEVHEIVGVDVIVKETNKDVREVIAYSLYMMQALGLISIQTRNGLNKVVFKNDTQEYMKDFKNLVVDRKDELLELLDV